jgi:hypothetical protein
MKNTLFKIIKDHSTDDMENVLSEQFKQGYDFVQCVWRGDDLYPILIFKYRYPADIHKV